MYFLFSNFTPILSRSKYVLYIASAKVSYLNVSCTLSLLDTSEDVLIFHKTEKCMQFGTRALPHFPCNIISELKMPYKFVEQAARFLQIEFARFRYKNFSEEYGSYYLTW